MDVADRFENAGAKFQELVRVMARLRAPGGCPWDRKQTFDSIKAYTLEETHEVMDQLNQPFAGVTRSYKAVRPDQLPDG